MPSRAQPEFRICPLCQSRLRPGCLLKHLSLFHPSETAKQRAIVVQTPNGRRSKQRHAKALCPYCDAIMNAATLEDHVILCMSKPRPRPRQAPARRSGPRKPGRKGSSRQSVWLHFIGGRPESNRKRH